MGNVIKSKCKSLFSSALLRKGPRAFLSFILLLPFIFVPSFAERTRTYAESDVTKAIAVQQQITITGTVTDASGEPLPGVSVMVKGTTQGTATDTNGAYTLAVQNENAILVFTYIGFISQELAVGSQRVINVGLIDDTRTIEEVVVVGYGTQKKANLTGAVSHVGANELTKRPSYSVGSLIQGRVPGLNIIQQTGEPGSEKLKVTLRGQGTFSSAGSNPLVVIDGVAYSSWTAMNTLAPDNIESIDVLKDAASASIYGSRAANGVILITTKRGATAKPTISYSGNAGLQMATFLPNYVTNSVEYMEMYNYTVDRQKTGTKFPDAMIQAYRNASPNDPQYPNFDWMDALFDPAWETNHNLTVAGGNDRTKYYAGFGYHNQNSILRGAQTYTRYTAQLNFDTKIADFITFGTSINALVGNKVAPAQTYNEYMKFVFDQNPTSSPRLPDGRWSAGAVAPPFTRVNNVMRVLDTGGEGGTWLDENHFVTMAAFLNINILPELLWTIQGSYTYDAYFSMRHEAVPDDPNVYFFQTGEVAGTFDDVAPVGVQNSWSRTFMPSVHSTLAYTKSFAGAHNVKALAGFSQEYSKSRSLGAYRRDYTFPQLTEINAGLAENQTTSGSSSEWAIRSLFGRLNYDYMGKYLFEANARYDGTSRIHKDNRWGFFPSFSAGWRVSEENFLKEVEWISNLKIRGSWGQLGNQNIGDYPYQSLVSTTNYAQGNGVEAGVLMTTLPNTALKWEVTTIRNIGLDLEVKQGLFSLTFELYNKDTEGILNRATIPASVGMTAPMINFGSMNNKGFEIVAGHRNQNRDFRYSVDFYLAHNRNKLTDIVTPSYDLNAYQIGYEYGAYYTLEWIGIFQSQAEIDAAPQHQNNPLPGDLRFKDQNGDNRIDANDRTFFSGRFPKFTYGGNINMAWRNFDLSVFLYGVNGTKHYITRRGEYPFLRFAAPTKDWRNAWTPENPTNKMPALYAFAYNPVAGAQNSYFLKNTSYFRVKNIQLGYTLPNKLMNKIRLNDVRIYISGDNILTFAPYTIHDPEREEDNNYAGETEAGGFPNLKTISFGIKLNLN